MFDVNDIDRLVANILLYKPTQCHIQYGLELRFFQEDQQWGLALIVHPGKQSPDLIKTILNRPFIEPKIYLQDFIFMNARNEVVVWRPLLHYDFEKSCLMNHIRQLQL